MTEKALLFAGGTLTGPPAVSETDFVIAVDSGLDHCLKFQITPQLVLGDFDSVSHEALAWAKTRQLKIISFPPQKNKTDTQLAVEHAIALGAKRIEIYGGLGSRFDHSLANVQLLLYILELGASGMLTDGSQRVYLLTDEFTLLPERGMRFSILPLSLTIEGLTIRGARYPLTEAKIKLGDTRTISNEFTAQPVKISLRKGKALLFVCPRSL
jgi:thiamine pyrophosphokinase